MAHPTEFGELGLSIIGLGTQYPPYALTPEAMETLAERFYPESPSLHRVIDMNRLTGIATRSSIGTADHPIVNGAEAPSIEALHKIFMDEGVPLAVCAADKAIYEAGIGLDQITHIVSTTCTNSANPGFDHFFAKQLGITHPVEKVLLHGVGCSGGLAALRTGANLALGHTARGLPARVLCVALEISTMLARSEMDSIHKLQETRIAACLFSDCASAVVLSNHIGRQGEAVYDLLGWNHRIIPETERELRFDVDPVGWKMALTHRAPVITATALPEAFEDLLAALPELSLQGNKNKAADFDWAMHPGGSMILKTAEDALGIAWEHLRASYEIYINHGNSSSAAIYSVMDELRSQDMDDVSDGGFGREYVVGCAFGPGVAVEMCMLRRNMEAEGEMEGTGLLTPSDTE